MMVNGQSSDNIFSFGPSEKMLTSFLRRNILYKPKSLISRLSMYPIRFMTKKDLVLPKTEAEKLLALFDDTKYTRAIDKSAGNPYLNYLSSYIDEATNKLNSYYAKEMYCKVLSYLQGSDNQVVLNSVKSQDFYTIIMPFATPQILYATVAYKDENLEIKKPKYVVEALLNKKYSKLKPIKKPNKFKKRNANKLIIDSYIYYDKLLNRLGLLK